MAPALRLATKGIGELRVQHSIDEEGPFYRFGPEGHKHRHVDGEPDSEAGQVCGRARREELSS